MIGKAIRAEYSRSGFCIESGGSSPDMAVNGSVTPVDFDFGPPSTESWIISNLLIQILTSTSVITDVKFGDIVALDVGVSAKIFGDSGDIVDFTSVSKIKSNNNMAAIGFQTATIEYDAQPNGLTGQFSFGGVKNEGLVLDGTKGEKFRITINDDLTALTGITGYVTAHLTGV